MQCLQKCKSELIPIHTSKLLINCSLAYFSNKFLLLRHVRVSSRRVRCIDISPSLVYRANSRTPHSTTITLESHYHENTCSRAAEEGHLEVLQWARSEGCPWDNRTCSEAAGGGRLAVLQWARSQGCPWDEDTCFYAASEGYLEVLQWARSQGCPWDEYTCSLAASRGHLEVLQWARSQGCPWDEDTDMFGKRKRKSAAMASATLSTISTKSVK